jgi:hypothetical protein
MLCVPATRPLDSQIVDKNGRGIQGDPATMPILYVRMAVEGYAVCLHTVPRHLADIVREVTQGGNHVVCDSLSGYSDQGYRAMLLRSVSTQCNPAVKRDLFEVSVGSEIEGRR